MIDTKLKKTIEKYNLLKHRDRLLLGISGGPDSMGLLHLFVRLKEEYKLTLIGAHFNHALRPEADQEETFVKDACRALGISCVSEKRDVKKVFDGDSLEQTARNLRFDFFLKVCRQEKLKKVALAHHKDDVVETILMRMIRGSGLRGLRGIVPSSKYKRITVVRPLLEIQKSEIIDFLTETKIEYCIDASNQEDIFLRNKIRLNLIPQLKKLNPNIVDTLFQAGIAIGHDYDFIISFARQTFQTLRRKEQGGGVSLALDGLKNVPVAVFNNVVRIALSEVKGDTRRIEARHMDEVRDLVLNRPTGSIVDLPSVIVQKDGNLLKVKALR